MTGLADTYHGLYPDWHAEAARQGQALRLHPEPPRGDWVLHLNCHYQQAGHQALTEVR